MDLSFFIVALFHQNRLPVRYWYGNPKASGYESDKNNTNNNRLGNVLLTRRIFGTLSVVQVQRINLANQKGFNTGLVTLLRYEISFLCNS